MIHIETSAKFNLGGNFESMIKIAQKGFSSLGQHIQATKVKLDAMERVKRKIDISANTKQLAKDIIMLERMVKPFLKPFKLAFQAKDAVTGVLNKIGSGISNLISKATSLKSLLIGLALSTAVAGTANMAFDKTIGANSTFEQQSISMKHFLGGDEAKSQSMMSFLEKNAAKTPFKMADLMPAASRGVGITDGDIAKAQRLLMLSEDMAALTPGKSVGDAMEALADARMGEFERMKEFNMKFSMEDLQKGGFGGFLTQAEAKFKGGSQKLSESAAGLMSTISDNFETSFRKMGENAFKTVKPQLQKIVGWFDSNQDTVQKWVNIGSKAMSGLTSKVIDFSYWVVTNIPKAGEKLTGIWKEIEPIAMPILNTVWDILKSIGSWIGTNSPIWKSNLTAVWKDVKPYLVEFSNGVQATWDIVKPIIESIGTTSEKAFGTLNSAISESMRFLNEHRKAVEATAGILAVVLFPAIAKAAVQFGVLTAATIAHTAASWAETIALRAMYLWDTLVAAAQWLYNNSIFAGLGALISYGIQTGIVAAQMLVVQVRTIAAAVASGVLRMATLIGTAVQWAFNAAMWANPLTWIVMGILAVVGVIILLVTHWDWVKEKAIECWNTIMGWIQGCPDWLLAIIAPILLIVKHWDIVKAAVLSFWETIKSVFSNIGKWFQDNVIDPLFNIMPDWLKKFFGGGKVSVDAKQEGDKNTATLNVDGSHANGLSYVPFDGYIAELHKGERVMTASENKASSSSKTTVSKGGKTFNFYISGMNKTVREIFEEAMELVDEAEGTMGEVVFE